MGYLDLADSPLVIDAPARILGMFDDFWQRPIHGPTIDGRRGERDRSGGVWKGDGAGSDQVGTKGEDARIAE